MTKSMKKSLRRSITGSMGRFLAILAIIALGSGFLCGLQGTTTAMLATGQDYMDRNSLFDFRILCNYGLTDEDAEQLRKIDGVEAAECSITADVLLNSSDGEKAYKVISLPKYVSTPELQAGRMPENPGEVLADGFFNDETAIGNTYTVSYENSDDKKDMLAAETFKVVGICSSPLYINYERGSTTIGSGSLSGFFYTTEDSFDNDGIYSEIAVKLSGEYEIYSDEYEKKLDEMSDIFETAAASIANKKYEKIYKESLEKIEDGEEKYNSGLSEFTSKKAKTEKQLAQIKSQIDSAAALIGADNPQIAAQYAQYNAKAEIAKEEFEKTQSELAKAREELDASREELSKIQQGKSYVLDRRTNIGYACFESDAGIVEGVGRVFPVFFFLVAALVCITTMDKLIDEDRTQIGVLKALGYSNGEIMARYLVYAGSAGVAGCLVGIAVGTVLFPKVIWTGYRIMYNMAPEIKLTVDWPLCIIIFISFVGLITVVTAAACKKVLTGVPAELIRPKPPVSGKRLLLEKLFFWKHLKFLQKVSVRNVFRYRKRLVMMLLGIGGCTALLVTAFGMKDSIKGMSDYQFGEVLCYDAAVTFKENVSDELQESFLEEYDGIESAVFLHQSSAEASNENTTKSIKLIATDNSLEGYINLLDADKKLSSPQDSQAVICIGLAKALNLNVGDKFLLKNSDMQSVELTVSGIFDNNMYYYVIIGDTTAQSFFGKTPETNEAFINFKEGLDPNEAGVPISNNDKVTQVTVTENQKNIMENMLKSMDYIIALIVICAGALAFIVLYNLTNINITERIREIATIKVLGFYPFESASYVFREGLILVIMGCVLGLGLGVALLAYVLSQIKIDMCYFILKIENSSFLLAAVITLVFTALVDFLLYFKLEKINMAESLKSVE